MHRVINQPLVETSSRIEAANRRRAREGRLAGEMYDIGVENLTRAEQDVLRTMIQEGHARATADALGKSLYTVKSQVQSAMNRLGVDTVGQAMVLYDRHHRQ